MKSVSFINSQFEKKFKSFNNIIKNYSIFIVFATVAATVS